ncbi:MAG: FAD:protein FMN transferase [Candidatus Gygaella obscura]|nr:FAD:protein FMN transferase [Candidatus Gygaella obscura]
MIILKRFYFFSFFCLFLVMGCESQKYIIKTAFLMGTIVEVTCEDSFVIDEVFSEMKRLDDLLSKFNPQSEIFRLNQKKRLVVSEETFEVIEKAIEFNSLTDGAFDITIGELIDLWKQAIDKKALPDEKSIRIALVKSGTDKIRLNKDKREVILLNGVTIDLGGIAKGFIVDKAIKLVKTRGVDSCMINAGGDIYCLGKRNKRDWRVGVLDPRNDAHILKRINLEDNTVATSGDYQQFFEIEGKRYSHIIDPRSGYPVDNHVISVTVLADDATTADALSTAVFVLGKEKGAKIFEVLGVSGFIIEE